MVQGAGMVSEMPLCWHLGYHTRTLRQIYEVTSEVQVGWVIPSSEAGFKSTSRCGYGYVYVVLGHAIDDYSCHTTKQETQAEEENQNPACQAW
jgi:hypothetical protein